MTPRAPQPTRRKSRPVRPGLPFIFASLATQNEATSINLNEFSDVFRSKRHKGHVSRRFPRLFSNGTFLALFLPLSRSSLGSGRFLEGPRMLFHHSFGKEA